MEVPISNWPDHYLNLCYRKLLFGGTVVAVAIVILGPTVCFADVADFYVRLSCDPVKKVAKIENYIVYEGEGKAPPGTTLLSHIGKDDAGKSPVKFCNLGERRQISLSGRVDPDRPRYNKVEIYTGTRPTPYNVYVSNNGESDVIRISPAPFDYAVSIRVCGKDRHCRTQLRSDPSFDCNTSNSEVDRIICRSDSLSLLDASLFNDHRSKYRQKDRRIESLGNPEKWREKVFVYCSQNPATVIVSCISSQYESAEAGIR